MILAATNNKEYADGTVAIASTVRKLQYLFKTGNEGKGKEWINYQLHEDRLYRCQEEEQPNMQITYRRYQSQSRRTI